MTSIRSQISPLPPLCNVSSGGTTTERFKQSIPKPFIDEYHEYRKLLLLYQKRFEIWPDDKMRSQLFEQAINLVSGDR